MSGQGIKKLLKGCWLNRPQVKLYDLSLSLCHLSLVVSVRSQNGKSYIGVSPNENTTAEVFYLSHILPVSQTWLLPNHVQTNRRGQTLRKTKFKMRWIIMAATSRLAWKLLHVYIDIKYVIILSLSPSILRSLKLYIYIFFNRR